MNGREAARSGEWAQHFSNASCLNYKLSLGVLQPAIYETPEELYILRPCNKEVIDGRETASEELRLVGVSDVSSIDGLTL